MLWLVGRSPPIRHQSPLFSAQTNDRIQFNQVMKHTTSPLHNTTAACTQLEIIQKITSLTLIADWTRLNPTPCALQISSPKVADTNVILSPTWKKQVDRKRRCVLLEVFGRLPPIGPGNPRKYLALIPCRILRPFERNAGM